MFGAAVGTKLNRCSAYSAKDPPREIQVTPVITGRDPALAAATLRLHSGVPCDEAASVN